VRAPSRPRGRASSRDVYEGPLALTARQIREHLRRLDLGRVYRDLRAAGRGADLLVSSSLQGVAGWVHEVAGIPWVNGTIFPMEFRHPGDPVDETGPALGVDLGHVGPGVPEQNLGGLQPVLLPDPGGERVPKLIWMPAVGLPSMSYLNPLVSRLPRPPLENRLIFPLCQSAWRGEGPITRPGDGQEVGGPATGTRPDRGRGG
jgi:hypothetical protein